MSKSSFTPSNVFTIAYVFTFALSFSGYAIDQQCVVRHETCPDHVSKTTYTPSYQEMLKEKPVTQSTTAAAPVVMAIENNDEDSDGVDNTHDKCPQTPKGYKVDTKGCPKSVTLNINFAFASNTLPDSSIKDVEILTDFLKENPSSRITIIGHTDNIGIDARNQPRSEARAAALGDKLISNGIDKNRIKTSGKGAKNPIASNATDDGRAQNRRIEVQIK